MTENRKPSHRTIKQSNNINNKHHALKCGIEFSTGKVFFSTFIQLTLLNSQISGENLTGSFKTEQPLFIFEQIRNSSFA